MMFRSRHPLHALQGLQGLQSVVDAAHHIGRGAQRIATRVPLALIASRRAARRSPSVGHIVLAGAAVLAFAFIMSQATRRGRSRAGKIAFNMLLLALGVVVLSLRRSGRRYRF
jgi:hypothetical protein